MFVIFGTTSRKIEEEKGYFVCPQCQVLRPYVLASMQTWFTLFFIPLFPVGEKNNRHVECKECSTTFYPRVLDFNRYTVDGQILEEESPVAF